MMIEVWFVTNILQTDLVLIAVLELQSIKVIGFVIIKNSIESVNLNLFQILMLIFAKCCDAEINSA